MSAAPISRRRFLAAGGSALLLGCAGGARPSPRSGAPAPATEPLVRVGLAVGRPAADFQPVGGRYLVREARADAPIAVADDGERWGVARAASGELRVVDPRGWLSQPHGRPIRIEPLEPDTRVRIGEHGYAGDLEVLAGAEGVTVVNELPLEGYLRGVLAREMPGGEEAREALRAQAVAARTYAMKRLGSRSALGFDLHADVQDQVYGGEEGRSAAADAAVEDTRGSALLAGGNLIDAYYHSTCGGVTAAVEDAFPQPPLPYLVGVSDADGRGGFHCERSRYFRWRAAYAQADLERLLRRNLGRFVSLPSSGVGSVRDAAIVGTSEAGRVLALRVETTTGSFQVARNDVRWLFADDESPGLRSTLFLLRKERSRGYVESLTLTGGGWGHGVGMCQVGALGRAAAGAGHREILEHYYTGARVEQVYA